MLTIDISCVVVSILPTIHILTIKIQSEPHMLHMVKFGFIVNTVILTVITSLLQHLLEYEFHESKHAWKMALSSINILIYWTFFLLLFAKSASKVCMPLKLNLLFAIICCLVVHCILLNYKKLDGLCECILILKTTLMATLGTFLVFVDRYSVAKSEIYGIKVTDNIDVSLQQRPQKSAGYIYNAFLLNYKEVFKYEKVTLVYLVVFQKDDQTFHVERSFREFVNLYRDLRNSQNSDIKLQIAKNNSQYLSKKDVLERMENLQDFLNQIVLIGENEFIRLFLNIGSSVVEYVGYAKQQLKQNQRRRVQSCRYTFIPDVIWEDEREDSAQSSRDHEDKRQDSKRSKSYSQSSHNIFQ